MCAIKRHVQTTEEITHLINYTSTQPNTNIWYHKRRIILQTHSNGLYISIPKVCSRTEGNFFLSDKTLDPENYKHNGAIHVIAKILKNVMVYVAETETGAAYVSSKEALPI